MTDETKTQDQTTAQAVDLHTLVMLAKSLLVEQKPTLKEIWFSKSPDCRMKNTFYNSFEKLPKQSGCIWIGIPIIENEMIPKNMMVWKLSDGKKKVFVLSPYSGIFEMIQLTGIYRYMFPQIETILRA